MKTADKEAVKVVKKATKTNFTQHVRYCQQHNQPQWDDTWRRVRLTCPACLEGYLIQHYRGIARAQCSECGALPVRREVFFQEKARIALKLVVGEDTGELHPYIMVEPKDRVPA